MDNAAVGTISTVQGSQMLRLLYLGALVLLLQIPVLMIAHLVSERESRKREAIADISSKWGHDQVITGPVLVVPYLARVAETLEGGAQLGRTETRNFIVLPERLSARGNINTEIRKRGIFSVPVYRADLTLEGEFGRPDLNEHGIDPAAVDWPKAYLALGIADTRAIQQGSTLTWNTDTTSFLPGTKAFSIGGPGIHAPVEFSATDERISFSFPIALNGSTSLHMVPFGRTTTVELGSNYGHPSFQGNWLPISRTISPQSFEARWSIPYLGRGYPQAWTSHSLQADVEMQKLISASRFGVGLVSPVDTYRMAQRSVKYAALFILLTFATVWLFEILAGVRVHAIQYLMLGGALCLFYLLELSLSEHLGFTLSYIIAALAVVAMVGSYSLVALHKTGRALGVATGVATLYGYLYLLLQNDDYALLAGSVGLFIILGATMYATRKVNWYATAPAWKGGPKL